MRHIKRTYLIYRGIWCRMYAVGDEVQDIAQATNIRDGNVQRLKPR